MCACIFRNREINEEMELFHTLYEWLFSFCEILPNWPSRAERTLFKLLWCDGITSGYHPYISYHLCLVGLFACPLVRLELIIFYLILKSKKFLGLVHSQVDPVMAKPSPHELEIIQEVICGRVSLFFGWILETFKTYQFIIWCDFRFKSESLI